MNRAAVSMSLVASIALLGCGKSSAPPPTAATVAEQSSPAAFEIAGVALGRPLGGSPLAERLKKENPIVGPHAESVGGAHILFSRVQLDASKNVEALYLKFDEEDYEEVKGALAERYAFECKAGKATDKKGRQANDELCIHTAAGGSVALRRRDQRLDTSSVGLISEALGKPSLDEPFSDEEKPRQHKGT
jgi:hypothetical protein